MSDTQTIDLLSVLGRPGPCVDYVALGFDQSHIPALLALLAKPSYLDDAYPADEEDPGWYASIHAWMVLGQLQAVEAIPALIEQIAICEREDIDWYNELIPEALGQIGAPAVAFLDTAFADHDNKFCLMAARRCVEAHRWSLRGAS